MDADLDSLCTVVYCTADDLLPEARADARRKVTDAEVVTLCVAQAIMGIPSDRRFLRTARRQLGHLFPRLPGQSAYFKRGRRLADTLEWLLLHFAQQSPGYHDELLLIDSTPVECGRSRETAKRSELAEVAGYGYCAAHSRWSWGLRLHALCAPDGAPRALTLAAPSRDEREDGVGPHLAQIRQRIESIFWTTKDLLALERHGARTTAGLRERIAVRFLCLAACISLNHRLGRPSRALVSCCA